MAVDIAAAEIVDLARTPLRDLNQRLHDLAGTADGPRSWRIVNPSGMHNIACGLREILLGENPLETERLWQKEHSWVTGSFAHGITHAFTSRTAT